MDNLSLFKQGPVVVFKIKSTKGYPIESISENCYEVLGYPSIEFTQNKISIFDLIFELDYSKVIKEIKNSIKKRLDFIQHEPFRIRHASGKLIWILDFTTIIKNDTNTIKEFQGYIYDITRTKENEEKLEKVIRDYEWKNWELETYKKELELSEQRWKFALEGSGDGVWDWNILTDEVFFSTQWKKMLGYENYEISNSFEELQKRIHPDDIYQVNEDIKKHLNGEVECFQNEHRVICRDWTYKWIFDRAKIVEKDDDGKPIRMIGTSSDISKRIEMENKLKESIEMLDLFFAQSLDGFFFMMLDEPLIWNDSVDKDSLLDFIFSNQRITKVNDSMLKQYKAQEKDFIGLTPKDFYKSNIEFGKKIWKKFFDEGRLKIATETRDFEGNQIWVEGDYICLFDKYGKIIGHFGVQRDITQRKINEDELKKLALVAEKIDNAIIIADEEDNIEWVNDGFVRMTGYSLEETINKNPTELLPGIEILKGQITQLRKSSLYKESVTAELINYKKNGDQYWSEITMQPIYDNTNHLKLIAIEKDITERKIAEEQLTESRNQFQSLVNNIPGITYRCKHDEFLTMLYISSNVDPITGYSAEDLLFNKNISFTKLIHEDDKVKVKSEVNKGIENKIPWELEYRIKHKDGGIRWVYEKGRAIFNLYNEIDFQDGFILDITNKKVAEDKLKERETFLKMIQETVQVGIVLINKKSLLIQYINPKAEELIGMESRFVIGKKCQDIFCLNESECPVCVNNKILVNAEKELKREDGRIINILKSTSFITLGDEELLLESFIDISDKKLAEEKLKETERRYNGIVNNSSDAIFLVSVEQDKQFRFIGNNPTHQRLTGISYEFLKNKTPLELLGVGLSEVVISNYSKCLDFRLPYTYEETLNLPAGELTWLTSLIPITNDNNEIYMLAGIARDITERKKYELEIKSNEEKIRESDQYHRTLLRSIPDLIFVLNKDGMILDFKADVKDLYVNSKYFIGKIYRDLFSDEISEKFEEAFNEAFSKMEVVEINYSLLISEDIQYFEARIVALGFEKLIVVVRNISDKIESEKIVRQSEIKFRMLFETLPTGVIIADKNGNILNSNTISKKILGIKDDQQLITITDIIKLKAIKPDGSIFPDEDYASNRALRENKPIYGVEMGIIRNPEDIAWIIVNASPVPELGVVISLQEITELKRAQLEIRESELKFRSLSESAKDGIIIINSLGNVNFWNKGAVKIFGYNDYEILGKNLHDILTPDELFDAHLDGFREFIKSGNGRAIGTTLELPSKHKNGNKIDIELSLSSVFIRNEWQAIGIVRDISERKIIEQELKHAKDMAENANAAKSEFLANMSHEIRTPMNSILGFSEILLNTISEEKYKKHLETILTSGKTLLALINDILDLSKIESGKMELNYEMISISSLIKEIVQIFSQKASQKDLTIKTIIDPNLPKGLNVDEVRFRQILLNLLGNAIKFTENGSISLILQVEFIDPKLKYANIKLIVEDTGIGIKADQLDIIFDSFQQQDGQSTRKYGGTGLGLAISKKLVEMMNGKISVESILGIGSKFIVDLYKVSFSDEFIESSNIFEWENNEIKFNNETILVVDDIAYNRELVMGFFKDTNLSFIEAENGLQAIEYVNSYSPSLILMDIRMPLMNGFEATLKIKENYKELPVIAFTASAYSLSVEDQSLFDGFLRKPLQKNELLKYFTKYLKYSFTKQNININTNKKNLKSIFEEIKISNVTIFDKINQLIDNYFDDLLKYMDLSLANKLVIEMESLVTNFQITDLLDFTREIRIAYDSFDFELLEEKIKHFKNEFKLIN